MTTLNATMNGFRGTTSTTAPEAGPLARLRLAERQVVLQLEAAAAEVDAIGTSLIERAEERLAGALARAVSRMAQARARCEQKLAEATARLEQMAEGIAADVAASRAIAGR